jgi:hypothetical protein
MANKVQVIAKLARNLEQLGQVVSRPSAESLVCAGITVSYASAQIASPMGGVSDTSSPFLGTGVQAPGAIKLKGAAGENSVATIFVAEADLLVLSQASKFANDIVVEAGDTVTQLARLAGHADLLMMGE